MSTSELRFWRCPGFSSPSSAGLGRFLIEPRNTDCCILHTRAKQSLWALSQVLAHFIKRRETQTERRSVQPAKQWPSCGTERVNKRRTVNSRVFLAKISLRFSHTQPRALPSQRRLRVMQSALDAPQAPPRSSPISARSAANAISIRLLSWINALKIFTLRVFVSLAKKFL